MGHEWDIFDAKVEKYSRFRDTWKWQNGWTASPNPKPAKFAVWLLPDPEVFIVTIVLSI